MTTWLKLNEMMSVIKMGAFLIRGEGFNEMRGLGEQWPGKLLRWNVLWTDPVSGKSSLQKWNRITK